MGASDDALTDAIVAALGAVPPVVRAEAFVYPAAAPAFVAADGAARPRPASDHLRLYVHVPFCAYHCRFCHFATVVGADRARQQRYVDAVIRELDWIEPGTPLSQLFVGGGTPTALAPDLLDRLLGAVFGRTRPHGTNVHTVEASPESVAPAHLAVLASHGVGRVSMGVQSLDDDVLAGVARGHGRAQALAAIDRLVGAGFIVNVDLMYGLPGQSEAGFRDAVAEVAARGVHSMTLYAVRVTPTSSVGRAVAREGRALELATLFRWRRVARDAAIERGYAQVRGHTFKRRGTIADRHVREVCHDERVQGLQLGVGMSARSQLLDALYRNRRGFDAYVEAVEAGRSPVDGVMVLRDEDRGTKLIARTIGEGGVLARAAYALAVGRSLDADHGATIAELTAAGLLEEVEADGGGLRLTATGRLLYDRVLVRFYPPAAVARLRTA
jgi:oxygen-independent coproporphyrinogen-3 oxidase